MPADPSAAVLDEVAAQFALHRARLFAIAHRALGSPWSADDAVQETWLRLQRSGPDGIDNLEAWLTTVVSRVCIDMIRRNVAWREDMDPDPSAPAEPADAAQIANDPAGGAMRVEELTVAMQVVLDTLGPRERLALLLHDVFDLPFHDIAAIVGSSPANARQLASRARARLRTADPQTLRRSQGAAVDAFLDAARNGDFGRLLQLLDPDIELRGDDAAVALAESGAEYGAPLLAHRVVGADAVARAFAGRAALTRLVHIDGVPAAAYTADGVVHAAYLITFCDGRISRLDIIADAERLAGLHIAVPT
ncbi:sigma-70 family RNA polymerase sigma factor [Melissospora conviva]|uniref:sigma-70 family RNA polymerase sigma factor n=1 Tax=Melissospora conviva TaxID=3388432 RepID=UPI003B7ADE4E